MVAFPRISFIFPPLCGINEQMCIPLRSPVVCSSRRAREAHSGSGQRLGAAEAGEEFEIMSVSRLEAGFSKLFRMNKSTLFLERLAGEVLVGDGAMGTLLYSRGVPLDVNFEHLNLVQPETIRQVHQDYAAAGAQVLETNTFGANALRLGAIGLEKKVRAINAAGVRLARDAAGPERFVAGAVGPLLRPRGSERELHGGGETRDLSGTDGGTGGVGGRSVPAGNLR